MTLRRIGVVPYKMTRKGPRVLMVTSLTRNRWVFPKGAARSGEPDAQACQREAFEEAGVHGRVVDAHPIEALIDKSIDDGLEPVPVTFYPLLVGKEDRRWPEKQNRKRRWYLFPEVIPAVERDTAAVFKQFAKLVKARHLPLDPAGKSRPD